MKKGINILSFPKEQRIIECIETAKKAGFDGIELRVAEKGELDYSSTEKEILVIKKLAKEAELEIPSLIADLYWREPFTAGDKGRVKKSISLSKEHIRIAKDIGADTVLIIPGVVNTTFMQGIEPVNYKTAYERSLAAFIELAETAEKYKIKIGIENVWNMFLTSPLEMKDFIEKIGSQYAGVYLDVGNVLFNGLPEHWIDILGKTIKRVHLKDFKYSVGNVNGFVDLLEGDVNWPAVMSSLKKTGYDGYLIAEMLPPYRFFPEQRIYNTSKAMDKIMSLGG